MDGTFGGPAASSSRGKGAGKESEAEVYYDR